MRTSAKGIALIKSFEDCKFVAYADIKGVPTIGWGTTQGVRLGMRCTQEEADRWFERDIAKFEAIVSKLVKVPLTQGQYDALVSLTYNCGPAPLQGTLGEVLAKRRYDAVPAQFMRWVNAGAKKNVKGLVRRRREETALWREIEEVVPNAPIDVDAPITPTPAKPLTDSSTIKGAVVAGTATVAVVGDTLSQVQTHVDQIKSFTDAVTALGVYGASVAGVIALGGVGWMLYRRIADREYHI